VGGGGSSGRRRREGAARADACPCVCVRVRMRSSACVFAPALFQPQTHQLASAPAPRCLLPPFSPPFSLQANDDVRQEVFVMQILSFFDAIFPAPLQLRPYRILATGPSSGLIEMVTDTLSIDRFKKRSGFPSLRAFFEAAYGPPDAPSFLQAQRNFVCSLAAYSVACYVLGIKVLRQTEPSPTRKPCLSPAHIRLSHPAPLPLPSSRLTPLPRLFRPPPAL
jgi:hypothetical protein